MKMLSISDVTAGSVLATDLKGDSGSLILSYGTELSEGILARLQKMGVETVIVEFSNTDELVAERKELLAAIEQRFSDTEGNPYLQEMKRIAIEHIGAV